MKTPVHVYTPHLKNQRRPFPVDLYLGYILMHHRLRHGMNGELKADGHVFAHHGWCGSRDPPIFYTQGALNDAIRQKPGVHRRDMMFPCGIPQACLLN